MSASGNKYDYTSNSGNQALWVNRNVFRHADLEITVRGSDWYFAVCSIMGFTTLAFLATSFRKPRTHRLFHYISAAITWVACIAYFTMGSNLGQVPIVQEWSWRGIPTAPSGGPWTREVFYVRYIDWFITTPLLLLDLLLTAALPWPTILVTILLDEIMIVCGLVGALIPTRYKWAFWAFGTASMFFVFYNLLWTGRRHAAALGEDVKKAYYSCGVVMVFVWLLYPIAWGCAEGGNIIHPDSEAVFYGVLDILAKPVFGALLLWGHRHISPTQLGLNLREPGDVAEKAGADGGPYAAGTVGPNVHPQAGDGNMQGTHV